MTTKSPELSGFSGETFAKEILNFASSIDGLLVSLPGVMNSVYSEHDTLFREIQAVNNPNAKELGVLKQKQKRCKSLVAAYNLIHRSFLTSQISQYDAYVGRLLSVVFHINPERVLSSEKQITGKDLLQFRDLEEVKETFIHREVDAFVRKSHEEQIKCLKRDFGVEVGLVEEITKFIEIAQRRHLFVHCDGVVSTLYIKNCKAAGIEMPNEVKAGDKLEVTPDYLKSAFQTVFAVGVKIGLLLWLKQFKDDRIRAGNVVNQLSLDLITNEQYPLAISLLEFALAGKEKAGDEVTFRYEILNLAQSYKWNGEEEKCLKLLKSHDWSASTDLIKLAVSVLKDDFSLACKLMNKVSHDETFEKAQYGQWPIFKSLRKQPCFAEAYLKIYGEPFAI